MELSWFLRFFHPQAPVLTGIRGQKKHFMMSAHPLNNQGASDELDSEVAFQHHNTLKVIIDKVMVEK